MYWIMELFGVSVRFVEVARMTLGLDERKCLGTRIRLWGWTGDHGRDWAARTSCILLRSIAYVQP